jgi:hypothetical protein
VARTGRVTALVGVIDDGRGLYGAAYGEPYPLLLFFLRTRQQIPELRDLFQQAQRPCLKAPRNYEHHRTTTAERASRYRVHLEQRSRSLEARVAVEGAEDHRPILIALGGGSCPFLRLSTACGQNKQRCDHASSHIELTSIPFQCSLASSRSQRTVSHWACLRDLPPFFGPLVTRVVGVDESCVASKGERRSLKRRRTPRTPPVSCSRGCCADGRAFRTSGRLGPRLSECCRMSVARSHVNQR